MGVKICTNITLIIPLITLIPGKIPEFIYKIGNLRGFFIPGNIYTYYL